MTTPPAAAKPTPRGHNFKESFMRMKYASKDGSRVEWIWNSRDGITPFIVFTEDDDKGGVELSHVDWHLDQYRPGYTPEPGERVFVTLTEEAARPKAVAYVEKYWEHPERSMREVFAPLTKEETVEKFVTDWLSDWGGYPPEVAIVTPATAAQFRARAEEYRKGWRKLTVV